MEGKEKQRDLRHGGARMERRKVSAGTPAWSGAVTPPLPPPPCPRPCSLITVSHLVFQGEKNAGFDVLYHNMKHGQLASKELAEFVRERWGSGGAVALGKGAGLGREGADICMADCAWDWWSLGRTVCE